MQYIIIESNVLSGGRAHQQRHDDDSANNKETDNGPKTGQEGKYKRFDGSRMNTGREGRMCVCMCT